MSRRNTDFIVLTLICLGLILAWIIGHTQDDAFITFRYSQNLVNGHGPVYNPGEYVEGYSNFLWMLVMAIPIALGMDPVTPSWLLGLLCLGANLWLCYRLFSYLLKSHLRGLFLFSLLLTHDALLGFGTSGMETAMNALLWTGLLSFSIRITAAPPTETPFLHWLGVGILAALCILSRPDGALVVVVCGGFLLRHAIIHKALVSRNLIAPTLTFFSIILVWVFWKMSFYGNLLPNTFYAKSGPYLMDGLLYIGLFFLSYGLFVPIGMFLLKSKQAVQEADAPWAMLIILVALWAGYLVWVGGDFMFFRMWVPVLPALYLLLGLFLYRQISSNKVRVVILGLLLLANLLHFPGFANWYPTGFVLPLQRWSSASVSSLSYSEQGKVLGELFGSADPPVRLAVGAAGASPYYSGLWATDIYGLIDAQVAREGISADFAPGHRTLASFAMLMGRKVNLWIYRSDHQTDLPDLEATLKNDPIVQAMRPMETFVNARMWMVQIPVKGEYILSCIYPIPHPAIDTKIQQGDFQLLEVFFNP